ncbi:response regulator transcription factor [Thiofaba sp. EF100]|uniref:response regulator transcription factor n=1 Tax=Thiofaba sp. EF100 TaxID=3121274 RepID=UPI0032216691
MDIDRTLGPIVVATADPHLLRRWVEALAPLAEPRTAASVRELEIAIRNHRPISLLLDLDLIGGPRGLGQIHQTYPDLRVMAVTADDSLEEAVAAIKAGAHGHLHRGAEASLVRRAVRLMSEDGLWAERRVLEAIIFQLVSNDTSPPSSLADGGKTGLDVLSEREREVANLVSDGLCYKSIARRLDISENTVRNHLRNIYRKLGLTGMLQLGLLVRAARAGSTAYRH